MQKAFDVAELPEIKEPISELLRRKRGQHARLKKRRKAEEWMPINFPEFGRAFGVVHFGDPHLDDNGCDIAQLEADIALVNKTRGLYAGCVGDVRNNWVGRLIVKFMDQSTTDTESRQLARWFLRDAGIPWVYCLMGNHDLWNEGKAILGLINDNTVYCPSWEARLLFRSGRDSWKIHVAHDFKGHSRFNRVHGPTLAATEVTDAELYVCGHKHTHGTASFVPARNDRYVRIVRCGAYKEFDDYALVNGFPELDEPASVMTIFNPRAPTRAGRITVFECLESGADYLGHLRRKK